jgi:hypothetical protein
MCLLIAQRLRSTARTPVVTSQGEEIFVLVEAHAPGRLDEAVLFGVRVIGSVHEALAQVSAVDLPDRVEAGSPVARWTSKRGKAKRRPGCHRHASGERLDLVLVTDRDVHIRNRLPSIGRDAARGRVSASS